MVQQELGKGTSATGLETEQTSRYAEVPVSCRPTLLSYCPEDGALFGISALTRPAEAGARSRVGRSCGFGVAVRGRWRRDGVG